ncbi:MAG: EF-P lysine aminoacylase GenX [Kiritimatiellae bacterium]|nr:EF-P lysine aminoacylase GenX [Kiritimatiellia bacterium]
MVGVNELATAERRAGIIRAVRAFFDTNGFIEVETPARILAPAPESQIDAPPSGPAFLRASPELQMKLLLCAGYPKIYQIGPCFRLGECGRRHNPEFTLLEWYRADSDYLQMLSDTEGLLTALAGDGITYRGRRIDLRPPWPRVRVRDAFLQWAGWDPVEHWDADRFDLDMVSKVEPSLPQDRPCVLMDYPEPAASLARLKPDDGKVAERWEVYIGGLELANAYSELCDAAAQRRRFEESTEDRRALGKAEYPLDEDFLGALEYPGMPPSGGIALGVDRLVMLLTDAADIADVRQFCQRPGQIF